MFRFIVKITPETKYMQTVQSAGEIKKRLERNWIQFLNTNSARLSSKSLYGATPPSVFVGRYGYPKVNVGPLVPPLHGDTAVLDMPEKWLGKSIEEIINYRLSLVRGVSSVDIKTTSGKYIESLQQVAMASKSAESEVIFEKQPVVDTGHDNGFALDIESAPFGPSGQLKTFKISSTLSVDQRLEDVFYDKDLRAADAISSLYKKGVEISRIHRVLSMGMLGVRGKRRIVPTKWSISATDDIISTELIRNIGVYPDIDLFEVHEYSHLGNYYSVILIPDNIWSFEMQEAWFDENGGIGIGVDFENADGLDHYPSIAGAYFAARLSIAEHLLKRRRRASALVLREIRPQYVIPVGVWQIREGIRQALKEQGKQLNSFEKALHFACIKLSVSEKEWLRNSKIYKNMKEQRKITDFFDG
jgi:hypothetical protein